MPLDPSPNPVDTTDLSGVQADAIRSDRIVDLLTSYGPADLHSIARHIGVDASAALVLCDALVVAETITRDSNQDFNPTFTIAE